MYQLCLNKTGEKRNNMRNFLEDQRRRNAKGKGRELTFTDVPSYEMFLTCYTLCSFVTIIVVY